MYFFKVIILGVFILLYPKKVLLYVSYSNEPLLNFETTVLECDTLQEGEAYQFVYRFQNTGTAPLRIQSVKSSCGCYVPQWPKESILPGELDSIVGVYSSQGRPGPFQKSLTVKSNDATSPIQILRCKGYTRGQTYE